MSYWANTVILICWLSSNLENVKTTYSVKCFPRNLKRCTIYKHSDGYAGFKALASPCYSRKNRAEKLLHLGLTETNLIFCNLSSCSGNSSLGESQEWVNTCVTLIFPSKHNAQQHLQEKTEQCVPSEPDWQFTYIILFFLSQITRLQYSVHILVLKLSLSALCI